MRKLILILSAVLFCLAGQAQIMGTQADKLSESPKQVGYKLSFVITESGDTLPVVNLTYVTISEERTFANKREARKWSRLKRDVAKVYPYSKLAGKKLKHYNDLMQGKSEKEQKKLMEQAEEDLKAEFEDDIRNMTLNQGRILIKLIDRETGNSSYALVKDLRGTFQAFFWQSIARIFSTNLKESYNPHTNKEDKMIEDIIETIENGTFTN
ncbi:MAG: DUF4294 domain-containing protein [Bacteroidetes bacterium]|nr:DUF4294 domain-containing protein [Bacteroidota bacterium]